MKLQSIAAKRLSIPFVQTFKHAAAVRDISETLWVEARTATYCGTGEGCPRPYVTHETLGTAQYFVDRYRDEWLEHVHDLRSLRVWAAEHRAVIDQNLSAWCAVELAILDALGKETKQTVESLLGTPEVCGTFEYTAVLGEAPQDLFGSQLTRYIHSGFSGFKVKLIGDMAADLGKIVSLRQAGLAPECVRFDANNLWRDADTAIEYLRDLSYPITAIEEPLRPRDWDGLRQVTAALGAKVILDESATQASQLNELRDDPETWMINVRVSKMGGVVRALQFVHAARRCDIPIIVGAHVGETSVLTRAALTVATAARPNLYAMEGAFGTHLLRRDIVALPLMFGMGGRIDALTLPSDESGGLNLAIDPLTVQEATA